jgi:hypothetical protein
MPTSNKTTSEIADYLLAVYGNKKLALDVAKMFQDRAEKSILLSPDDREIGVKGWQEVSEAIIYEH